MYTIRSLRTGTGLMATAALIFLLIVGLSGCSDTDDSPMAANTPTPPEMPAAEQLQFDFGFFDEGAQLEKAAGDYDNFVNAYLRSVLLEAVAHLVLVAPVSTFSAALNTVPVAQEDGSWVWTYDWHYGPDPITVILRGLPVGDVVEWEMSLSPVGTDYTVVWFTGTTNGNGQEGHWLFHDLDTEGFPVSGEIIWGRNFLEFVGHDGDAGIERLRFSDNAPDFSIEFTPGDGSATSFIRWNDSGTGSLQVPDYNEGLEACWDVYQQNTVCQ